MKNTVIRFTLSRDTKNTHRYDEVQGANEAAIIGALYVRKGTFENGAPVSIAVTITAAS